MRYPHDYFSLSATYLINLLICISEFLNWFLPFIEPKSVKVEQYVVEKDVNLISLSLHNPTQELIREYSHTVSENLGVF